jgi:hypothetical protein
MSIMKSIDSRWALAAALLPWMVVGCATRAVPESASAAAPKPALASAPPAAVSTAPQPVKPAPTLAAPNALETQYGIQVAQVGVTAAGGLVDVRFKVLDAVKVRALLADPANVPMLIAGDKPPLMAPHHALRGAKFGQGQVFYILYPNLRGAIQPGAEVTVAMGELRFGPVTAQ